MRERVKWLSGYINENLLPAGRNDGIERVETGADLVPLLGRRDSRTGAAVTDVGSRSMPLPPPRTSGPATPPLDVNPGRDQAILTQTAVEPPQSNLTSPLASAASVGATSSSLSYATPTEGSVKRRKITRQAPPPAVTARRFVDAYFRNVNRAYPFVNQAKVRSDLENIEDLSQRRHDPSLTLVYLVMAIGCTTLERAGQIPSDTVRQFDVAYSDIIQECLSGESLESVQILVLLALYSLFDPNGTSAYSIIGIAARQSMVLGLTRRSSDESTQPAADIELRHRLYWSIYVFDRMMAASQGLSVALIDDNADVPLPGLTIDEFAGSERATYARNLQTSRHVIQLRQLEERILQQVHLRRQFDAATLAPADKRAVLANIRSDIEDWYSNGCLMSPMEADNVPIHSSITWLSARYYHMLVMLYYPNHFNSSAAAICRSELLQFARKLLQSNTVLFQQRQLPLNRVTLCRMFPACLILMHDFVATFGRAEWAGQSSTTFSAREEVTVVIATLDAFPAGWLVAHHFSQIMQQFASIIAGGLTPYFSQPAFPLGASGPSSGKESIHAVMKPCILGLAALMQSFLGRASCFQYVEFPPEDAERLNTVPMAPPQQAPTTNSTFYPEASGEGQQAPVDDENVLDYGWSIWDLDFL